MHKFTHRICFSTLKQLYDDKRNHMRTKLIRVELHVRLNSALCCREAYEYSLLKAEVLELAQFTEAYSTKSNILVNS